MYTKVYSPILVDQQFYFQNYCRKLFVSNTPCYHLADFRGLGITLLGLEQRNLQHLTHWIGYHHLLQY